MMFNLSQLGLSSNLGIQSGRTVFYRDRGTLVVKSDGLPSPATANIEDANKQSYEFVINYRAESNTQSPTDIGNQPAGILANGVTHIATKRSTTIPGAESESPNGFNFDVPFFANEFKLDLADGLIEDSVYHYLTGKFLYNAWNNGRVENSNEYYRSSNFDGDHFRHTDGHSKIVGFAFDGYPIYGPYGYVTPFDQQSGTKLVTSGYITLPNDRHRPAAWKYDRELVINGVNVKLSPGAFQEDYVYRKSKGDLDKFNGRFSITPDYPKGTYAYFLTFSDELATVPAFPYITGEETKQNSQLLDMDQEGSSIVDVRGLWNFTSGNRLTTLVERKKVDILLPIANIEGIELEIISGRLPDGLRIENRQILGTVFEVAYNKTSTVVLRARYNDIIEDRTIEIAVSGPDNPNWITNEGLLPIGKNKSLFVLDSSPIDYQLVASDTDLPAGDELEYFIAEGDGVLPPGITLSLSGKLSGITEPLLSLDRRYRAGGYDASPYGGLPIDYSVLSSSGFSTFYYDTQDYDFNENTANPKKLNRYYPFAVTVTDGDSFIKRDFNIYVVGDDYFKADNTIMQSSSDLFTADVSNVRTPIWITPRDLGFKRADNYVTLYLDVIDNPTLEGVITFTLEEQNDDGTVSKLPPGTTLDSQVGEITGYVPYQPAITRDYKFTVKATRITSDLETVEVFATFYEDVLLGKKSFKVYKLDLTGDIDEVNDLKALIKREIVLDNRVYTVTSVDNSNQDYDIIFVDETLAPQINLILSRTGDVSQDHVFVSRLSIVEREKYTGSELRFSDNESYLIESVTPYIQYNIFERNSIINRLLPNTIPLELTSGKNYFVGDIVLYNINGNNAIFECVIPHTVEPLLDEDDNLVTDDNGNIRINFIEENWNQLSSSINTLSNEHVVRATAQMLKSKFGGDSYVDVKSSLEWNILIPSTSSSRNIKGIGSLFNNNAAGSDIKTTLIRDNEDRLQLATNLSRQLNQGRNIGIALFKNEFFSKNITITSTDDTVIPSTTKTFELKVIGEIDSNINWITPSDLGTINANFTSMLRVEAETTVPDTKMVYTLENGKLPNGMSLNLDGEILGYANQYPSKDLLGLTTFDQKNVSWDGQNPGDTTFDRVFNFTIKASDRFKYTAIDREFRLEVSDPDNIEYTDIYMRPMLTPQSRDYIDKFISDPLVFEPSRIYRPGDDAFGVQENFDMLVYAGIQSKEIKYFVAAAAKNHKRKRYILGEFNNAIARDQSTGGIVYEVVYIEVIDPAESKNGKTSNVFSINTENKITVDSIQYNVKDDNTKNNVGYDTLPVYGRNGIVTFVFEDNNNILVTTRETEIFLDSSNNQFEVQLRDTKDLTVTLDLSDSEPYRIRKSQANTIKSDSDAVKVSQLGDDLRYRSSIEHMRDNIDSVGVSERNFLPLWMRTPQNTLQELDYVTAIPICYCLPGESQNILDNIKQSNFNQSTIDYEIDRYIIKKTNDYEDEQYILFANYQFNV